MPSHHANRNSQYIIKAPKWKRARVAFAGEEEVKAQGEELLPKLGGQTPEQYDAYNKRARYFNSFAKTVKGHVGLAMRKPVVIRSTDGMEEINNNIDRKGSDIRGYMKAILTEILSVGRAGTLVDYTKTDSSATLADVQDDRPYWTHYSTEDILDWEFVDGNLVYLVLREFIAKRGLQSASEDDYRYRICEVVDKVYKQTLYEGTKDTGEEIVITVNGSSISFIPFVFHQIDFSENVEDGPLEDLVDLGFAYFRLKADHMHGLHFVALPTPYITGSDGDDDDPKAIKTIGPERIWHIPNIESTVGMLEFTGAGLSAIKDELDGMKDEMAILGSRVLLPEIAENTATAAKLRSLSETSDLASLVIVLLRQLNRIYAFTSLWAGQGEDVEIKLDTNFIPKEMDAGMLTALVAGWQSGAFDREVLTDNLQRAEIIDTETDVEEMVANIESEEETRMVKAAAAMAAMTDNSGDDNNNEEEDG